MALFLALQQLGHFVSTIEEILVALQTKHLKISPIVGMASGLTDTAPDAIPMLCRSHTSIWQNA